MADLPEIKNHTVKELIGQGRTGPVYKGIQNSLQRDVAIKVISPKLLAHQKVVDEFLHKARNAASISHPNVVSIYNVDQDSEDLIYYTMEFMPGGCLGDRIAKRGALALSKAAQLTLQVARALEFGHLKGQVHGNLKPSKILYMDDGETFKLSGVGLLLGVVAKHSARNPTPFTAPEVVQTERPADHRADIFALGGVFYAMLAGEDFFKSDEELWKASSSGLRIVRPSQIVSSLPREVDDIIGKMMAFDPDDRYEEYGDFFDVLKDLVEQAMETEAKAAEDKKRKKVVEEEAEEEEEEEEPEEEGEEEEEEPEEEEEEEEEEREEEEGKKGEREKKEKKKGKEAAAAKDKPTKEKEKPKTKAEEEEEEEDETPTPLEEEEVKERKKGPPPPLRRRAPEPRAAKLPIGSILMAVWSAILLGIVLKFLFLDKRKPAENPDKGKERPVSTVRADKTVASTTTISADLAPVLLNPLANAEARVNELVELCAEELDAEDMRFDFELPQKAIRMFQFGEHEFGKKLKEERYLDALVVLASLHDNHAQSPEEKKAARAYIFSAVKMIDRQFNEKARPIQAKIKNGELEEAKDAFRALGEEFKAERWKKRAQERIEQVDDAVKTAQGRPEQEKRLAAARAFDGEFRTAKARLDTFVSNMDFAKAAAVCKELLPKSPTNEIKKLLEAKCLEYDLQSHLMEQAMNAFNEKAAELNIPLPYGGVSGTIKAATKDGFTIQAGEIQAGVHYSKVKPKMLHNIYRRLSLDGDSQIGLAIFCYNNDMSQEGDQIIEKTVADAAPEQKAKIAKYLEGKEDLQEAGGLEAASGAYRAELEARDLYETASLNLAAGETTDALRRLQSIVETYANTTFLKKAKELIAQYRVGDKADDGPKIKLTEPGEVTGKGGDDLEEETVTSPGTGNVGEADRLYQKAKSLYAKAAPGMPDWQKFADEALKCLDQAIQKYKQAMEEDPENPVLQDKMADANRLKYALRKSRTLK